MIKQLFALAKRRCEAPAQVALAWLLHQSAVAAPIIGATQMRHIDDALAATSMRLEREERASLEAPYRPHPVHGH